MKFISPFIVLLVLFSSCVSDNNSKVSITEFSNDKSDIKAYNLVSVQMANEWLVADEASNEQKYITIQVSKETPFLNEHIPSALNIWRPDYGSESTEPYGGLIPSKDKLQSLLQELGFKKGMTLLLYDLKANVDAMRFAWVLNLYGFEDFKLINGGLKYWKQNNFPLTDEITEKPEKTNYILPDRFDQTMIANAQEVLAAMRDTNIILIDTREEYEFNGQPFINNQEVLAFKKGAFDRGSIPGAIHLNWSTLADLEGDHRIKSEKDLRYDLKNLDIASDKTIILYCQSGSRTSHTYYVLKHVLGYPEVKNYDGSWIEWSYLNSQNDSFLIQQICTVEEFKTKYDSLEKRLKQ